MKCTFKKVSVALFASVVIPTALHTNDLQAQDNGAQPGTEAVQPAGATPITNPAGKVTGFKKVETVNGVKVVTFYNPMGVPTKREETITRQVEGNTIQQTRVSKPGAGETWEVVGYVTVQPNEDGTMERTVADADRKVVEVTEVEDDEEITTEGVLDSDGEVADDDQDQDDQGDDQDDQDDDQDDDDQDDDLTIDDEYGTVDDLIDESGSDDNNNDYRAGGAES